MTPLPRIAVVGTGPVGRAIVLAQCGAGGDAVVVSRDVDRARKTAARAGRGASAGTLEDLRDASLVLVAVPDRAIGTVGARLALAACAGVVLHTSGGMPGTALGPGLRSGSLHPMQSFPASAPDDDLRARMRGAHWFHEGEGRDAARLLVPAWRGTFHALAPGGKALYHAGAAVVSNHVVALFADAVRLLELAGVSPAESRDALSELLAGTASNLRALGAAQALTGPVARGDVATVRSHVEALRSAAPELLPAYAALARRAAALARERGTLQPSAAAELEKILGG